MATIQIESSISLEQLLKAVSQLPDEEIGRFTEQVIALRAQRIAPSLTADEGILVQRVNRPFPNDDLQRYDELAAKRQAETLTPQEHAELLRLSDLRESHDAERMDALIELAQIRRVPLAKLMASLDIPSPTDA